MYSGGKAGRNTAFDMLSEESLLKLCEPIDKQILDTLRKRGYEVRTGTPGSETFAYLELREARAITFVGDEKLILLRPDATKSELLEEFLHNTQFGLKLNESMSLPELEVHVKDFMIRHAEILGINNKYDLELLQRHMVKEINKLPRNNP